MLHLFDRYYSRIILYGLAAGVWFSALFQAAHNVWSASCLFGEVTLLSLLFCAGRMRDRKPVKLPLLFAIALFLLALRLSLWTSYDLDTSWLEFWGWTFSVLMFYLFLNVIDSPQDVDRFFTTAGAVLIPLTFHCIWQRISPPPYIDDQHPTPGLRGYGLLDIPFARTLTGHPWIIRYGQWEIHANLVNSVVMAGFVLYWILYFWGKTRDDRRYSPFLIAGIVVLGFARSWWAFLSLAIGLLFYERQTLARVARRHQKTALALGGGLLFLLAAMVYIKTHHGVERAADLTRYHASSRWHYWLAALHMWRSSPWTGVGLGGYATAYPHFKVDSGEYTLFAHGLLPQLISETGLLGGIACVVLVGTYLRMRLTSARKSASALTRGLDVTLVVILCFSLISINLDFLLNKFTLFLLLAATLWRSAPEGMTVRPLWLATAGCGLVLLTAFWLNLFAASRLYTSGLYWEEQGDPAKAIALYQDAIRLEPYHADSYWRLSNLYAQAFKMTGSPAYQSAARAYQAQALRYKNDRHFLKPS